MQAKRSPAVVGQSVGMVGCAIPLLTTGQLVDADRTFLPSQWAVDWMRAEVIFDFCIQSTQGRVGETESDWKLDVQFRCLLRL